MSNKRLHLSNGRVWDAIEPTMLVATNPPQDSAMTPTKAAATIQRIADSGLDLDTSDYRALVEIAQWLMTIPAPLPADWAERAEWLDRQREAE